MEQGDLKNLSSSQGGIPLNSNNAELSSKLDLTQYRREKVKSRREKNRQNAQKRNSALVCVRAPNANTS